MRMHGYGDVSVLSLDEVAVPRPGAGEVLLRVAATSFNPSEVGLRRGLLRGVFTVDLPHTLGNDVAGVVEVAGPGVPAEMVGRRVIARIDGGAAADFTVAPAEMLVAAPERIPLPHAASLPIAGLTAWQAVFAYAGKVADRRVLVIGAGAVGRIAVQLARFAGARVVVAAGRRHHEALLRLGADEVFDLTGAAVDGQAPAQALGQAPVQDGAGAPAVPGIGPVDVLLNCAAIGAGPLRRLAALIRDGGVLVSAATPVDKLATPRISTTHFVARNDPGHLAALVKLVDTGAVRVDVAASRPLADLPRVHRDAENGVLPGKTILLPGPSAAPAR
jgi:NADPH:quinone reductase-like Zn-dependent oxidoreductase